MQRTRNRRRLALLGILALALSVTAGMAVADTAAAKKKKKNKNPGGTVDITMPVNAQVPDATGTGPTLRFGVLTSTINVAAAKPFIGTVIRDVNVTVKTTGNASGSVPDLRAFVTAPNGATSWLFAGLAGQSLGPLTLDDQTPVTMQPSTGPPRDSTELTSPYAGTAQPYCFLAFGACPLAVLNGGPATGAWRLTVEDAGTTAGNTSRLDNWRLTMVAGRPFITKSKKK
jgi:hypothetical protein